MNTILYLVIAILSAFVIKTELATEYFDDFFDYGPILLAGTIFVLAIVGAFINI
jgi:hypothetical protein